MRAVPPHFKSRWRESAGQRLNFSGPTLQQAAPFGGFKASGLGRELGPEGLAEYTESRTIVVPPGFEPA